MVGTQGLFVLNDVSVLAASDQIADRLMHNIDASTGSDSQRVDQMYQWIVGTSAQADEVDEMLAFIDRMQTRLQGKDGAAIRLRAWSLACQALFASSRFQIIE